MSLYFVINKKGEIININNRVKRYFNLGLSNGSNPTRFEQNKPDPKTE